MPLTKLQSHVLRAIAAERSPDSYIAGGVINREGPRFSGDIDIFQDTEKRVEAAAQADAKALADAGLKFSWKRIGTGIREAEVEGLGEKMRLEWVHDSAFRFFPAQPDEIFGYVLHPADLAINKASAAGKITGCLPLKAEFVQELLKAERLIGEFSPPHIKWT